MAKIVAVEKNFVAYRLGIVAGDELLGFDGKPLEDILDYIYYDAEGEFVLNLRSKTGKNFDIMVKKETWEQLGITFGEDMEISPKRCKNKCVFCFVDQLPKGLRDTLYVKDDDYRLSFVCGNYVTLTNVGSEELQRIARLKLSPLYISVHATNEDICRKLIGNPHCDNLVDKMKYLSSFGIKMHTQIVLCPNINDKEVLSETLKTLESIGSVESVAVVPLGLTCHREKLLPLIAVDENKAKEVINLVEAFNQEAINKALSINKSACPDKSQNTADKNFDESDLGQYNSREKGFCWCSDEFYIKAKLPLKSSEYYADFSQIENGVGLIPQFYDELEFSLESLKKSNGTGEVTLITGESFYTYLKNAKSIINEKFPKLFIEVACVENNFFGESITVAGLLTGKDIASAMAGKCRKNTIIPSTMLREFSDNFLDGMTVGELEKALNTKIFVSSGAEELIEILCKIAKNQPIHKK